MQDPLTSTAPSHAAEIRTLVADEPSVPGASSGTVGELERLCRAAARSLPAFGVGLSVRTPTGGLGVAAASGDTSVLIEEIQFTVGEGPCIDAYSTGLPAVAADSGAMARWPGYSPAAHEHGVRAVFAFPLTVGASRLGVLDVYRDRPGALTPAALTRALAFADVALVTLLEGQEMAPPGAAADGLDDVLEQRFELHQAQGMVMVQLAVSVEEAMAVLRTRAYVDGRRLGDVARDVLARRLTFEQRDV